VLAHSGLIYVKRVRGKGRGVFARQSICEGTIIERVPVLLAPVGQVLDHSDNPVLGRYCFLRNRSTVALALGYGSLYNHSYSPNARYDEEAGALMVFTAIQNIEPGEEITINYNGDPADNSPVGFEVR
jgi:SET domain-containing protein